jgi:hypothetical protein
MVSGTSRAWLALALGLSAVGCGGFEPPVPSGSEQGKAYAFITVDRSDPALPDAERSASAIARFVTVPAYSDPRRALIAAGASVDVVPPVDTCQVSGGQEEIEPPLPTQGPVEFLEAGDVSISASGSVTPLVPHAFPTVGGFASGVLYTTRDRSGALPSAVPYVVSASGSSSVSGLHAVADAPASPDDVRLGGSLLGESAEVHTGRAIEVTWTAGKGTDLVYAELLAFDGSPSVLCTFHDEAGSGVIPAETFSGTGGGRIALHRVRTRHFEGTASPAGDVRFDFQVDAPVEYAK